MLDIGGFLTSTEFVAQIAAIITTLLSVLVSDFLALFFSAGL